MHVSRDEQPSDETFSLPDDRSSSMGEPSARGDDRIVEQQPPIATDKGVEPRLLTRPERHEERAGRWSGRPTGQQTKERATPPRRARSGHRQASPEKDLRSWAKRMAVRRQRRTTTQKTVPDRRAHRLFWIVGAVASFLLITLVGVTLYLRGTAAAALPALDGTEHLRGLRAPVEVARDAQGVPTLTASNLPDLMFAQGYVTAGDRLWQMDALRRHAAGELAEILGKSLVEHDRRQRYLQIRAAADRAVAQLPPDQLSELQAYAAGVNAYVETHGNALPLEFKLLAYRPAPWTPRDSLLVSLAMWQDLSTEFPRKLDRDGLQAHLPAALLADLYPVGSWRDQTPAAQGRDVTRPHNVEQIPLDPSQSRLESEPHASPASLLAMTNALMGGDRCEGCRSGSNNWVVSGARSASGAPLVSNDMHLNLGIPDVWYEASLHTALPGAATPESQSGQEGQNAGQGGQGPARLDVTGFTLPGVPFVIVGRNPRVAWGVTNLGADVQDLRVEHLRGAGDATEYQRTDGSWAPVIHRTEAIHVRGGLTVSVDVLTTTHANGAGTMETPILTPLYPGETRALSLAWTAYDPQAVTSPFFSMNTAGSGQALVAAFQHFGGPTLNLVWADADGHIGYHAVGWVPLRGPAVQHPRAVMSPVTPSGTAPPDEGSEGSSDEGEVAPNNQSRLQAPAPGGFQLVGAPRLVLSAYRPVRRNRITAATPRAQRHAAKPGRSPIVTRGRVPAAATERSERPPRVAAKEPAEDVIPEPPVVDYTVGSPIAALPVDAADVSQAWSAYVPYEAMPVVTDPKNGLLATANARITPDDYPYHLTDDWADPFRVERITHLLAGQRGLTPADMLRFQTDAHSDVNRAMAQRLAYAIDHASPQGLGEAAGRLHTIADLLRNWDGDMDADSAPAAILSTVQKALWPALLVPQIQAHDHITAEAALPLVLLYTWGEKTTALELLLQHEPSRWLPAGYHNWNDFLAATTAKALQDAKAPGNLQHWRYGDVHTVEVAHPIFGIHPWLSRLLGVRATTGKHPAPGDATTIDAIGAHFGPSERFTADLSTADAALGNVTTGQSGNPRSPWYLDQFPSWLSGQSFALPNAHSAVTHTLTLAP